LKTEPSATLGYLKKPARVPELSKLFEGALKCLGAPHQGPLCSLEDFYGLSKVPLKA